MNRTDTVLIPIIDGEVTGPITAQIPTYLGLPLLPPPALPRRLSPRRPPLRTRARRRITDVTWWVAYGPTDQRLFWLFIVCALGGLICLLAHLPHSDAVDGPR